MARSPKSRRMEEIPLTLVHGLCGPPAQITSTDMVSGGLREAAKNVAAPPCLQVTFGSTSYSAILAGSGIHPAVDDLVELGLSNGTRRWRGAEGEAASDDGCQRRSLPHLAGP